jgi:transposase InsO family protein
MRPGGQIHHRAADEGARLARGDQGPAGAHHRARPVRRPSPDLIRRQFKAARPGQPHVADFTYVQTVTGRFADTAFVINAFAGLIPGWECSLSEQTAFAEAAIRQAPPTGPGTGHPISQDAIHHSDVGSPGSTPACTSPRRCC